MRDLKIIVIREGLFESVLRDVFTFATLAGLIGLGVWVESTAMQWFGGLLGFLFVFAKAARVVSGKKEMTIQEARKKLDQMEGEGSDNG